MLKLTFQVGTWVCFNEVFQPIWADWNFQPRMKQSSSNHKHLIRRIVHETKLKWQPAKIWNQSLIAVNNKHTYMHVCFRIDTNQHLISIDIDCAGLFSRSDCRILGHLFTYQHIHYISLYRTRHLKTEDSFVIQRDANKWPGIL